MDLIRTDEKTPLGWALWRKGWSMKRLEREMHHSYDYFQIQRVCKGTRVASARFRREAAAALGMTEDEVFGELVHST